MYVSNEDFADNGSAPPEEKKERRRIYLEALRAKLSAGSVHAYVLSPDGRPIDSQHVAQAAKVEQLTAMLERTVQRLRTPAGKPVVPPTSQSRPPAVDADALVLHLVARNVDRKGEVDLPHRPKLGQTRSIGWGSYPAEDWIVLKGPEWRLLLPAAGAEVGTTWGPDVQVTARILRRFYPSTENNDISKNRIERQELRATVISVKNGRARALLEGSLRMKHPFYHKDDGNYVDSGLLGFLDFAVDSSRIYDFQLVSRNALYAGRPFGIAVGTVAKR